MARTEARNARNRNIYRTQGNVALVPVPKYAPTARPERTIEQEIRHKKRNKKTNVFIFLYMIFAITCVALSCARLISVQSDVTILTRSTAKLENQLLDATLSNDEEYARIMGAVDVEKIKQVAMEELGMKYPDESQVVDFVDLDSDYVRQFGKIPD